MEDLRITKTIAFLVCVNLMDWITGVVCPFISNIDAFSVMCFLQTGPIQKECTIIVAGCHIALVVYMESGSNVVVAHNEDTLSAIVNSFTTTFMQHF